MPRKASRNLDENARIFRHLWVDTPDKSRLTVMDVKAKGDPTEIIHVPTPTAITNAIFEFIAAWQEWPVIHFDIVAAFPHAGEKDENVFLQPPVEWDPTPEELEQIKNMVITDVLWHMLGSLYGRRPAATAMALQLLARAASTRPTRASRRPRRRSRAATRSRSPRRWRRGASSPRWASPASWSTTSPGNV